MAHPSLRRHKDLEWALDAVGKVVDRLDVVGINHRHCQAVLHLGQWHCHEALGNVRRQKREDILVDNCIGEIDIRHTRHMGNRPSQQLVIDRRFISQHSQQWSATLAGQLGSIIKALARDQPFVDEECGEFFLHITCHQCHTLPLLFLLRLPNDRLDRWVDRLLVKHCAVWLINRIRELLDCLNLSTTLRHLQEWNTTRHKKRHHY